jgi:peptide/nickel transport system substrate-binding protein
VFLAAVAACTPTSQQTTSASPSVLRIGLHSEPHSLSPILPQHAEEFMVARFYSDVLTSFDQHGNLVPMLAAAVPTHANGGISADERTIVYHLRHNVRWHDGHAFGSADVAFTWRAIMDPHNDVVSRDGYDQVARVDTPDAYTIRFHLKRRFAPIVAELFGDGDTPLGMLPAHLLAKLPELNDVPFDSAPIGTGPYRVEKWVRGERIELVANPDYYLGKPKIARITLLFMPDENTLIERLRTHEIDWLPEVSPSVVPLLAHAPGIHLIDVDQNHWFGLWFNLKSRVVGDVRVRRAIAAAIDKVRLTRTLTYGTADPATVDVPSFMWAYPRGNNTVTYDPVAARRRLAALGRPLPALSLAYDQSSGLIRATAVQLQSEFAAVGLTLQLHGYRRETMLGAYSDGGILTSGHYELALGRWLYGPDPDNSGEFGCAAFPPNGYNMERYCEPAMEAAQRDALEHIERPARRAAYARIEELVARDLPVLPLWWPRAVHAFGTDVHGFAPNSLISTWNSWEWSLGDGRR